MRLQKKSAEAPTRKKSHLRWMHTSFETKQLTLGVLGSTGVALKVPPDEFLDKKTDISLMDYIMAPFDGQWTKASIVCGPPKKSKDAHILEHCLLSANELSMALSLILSLAFTKFYFEISAFITFEV